MKSTKILVLVCAATLGTSAARAQWNHAYTAFTNLPIPSSGTGGAAGGVSNPANATSFSVNVPIAVAISKVIVGVDLTHPTVGDLRIEISHCGTTVMLYNQTPASTANLGGLYNFDSWVFNTFAGAIGAAGSNGTVLPGTYAPASSLAAFNGKSSAGPWTITIYDLAANGTGTLASLGVTVFGVAAYQSITTTVPIPDGSGGQCLAPVGKAISVPDHAVVGDLIVRINFSHTYVSDLDITLEHGGVSIAISQWSAPVCSADVGGVYGFWDGAATDWTAAEAAYSGTSVIPAVNYRPKQPLSPFAGHDQYGLWYLSICDRAGTDTGLLGTVSLEIERSAYDLALTQPNGSASITLTNSGGIPGDSFVNLFTLTQGSTPAGWIAGLDISLADLILQASFGPPFTGTLGPCGSTSVTVGGPVPSGLVVFGVSLELDANMILVATKPVFLYVTQ
jgi:subtilisin-like proprotein convertase family protein